MCNLGVYRQPQSDKEPGFVEQAVAAAGLVWVLIAQLLRLDQ